MDSRDFLFPLNRIVSLTSSSFLVAKDQPETVWHLLTQQLKSDLLLGSDPHWPQFEKPKAICTQPLSAWLLFTSIKEIRDSPKEVRVKTVENVLQQIDRYSHVNHT
jgi:hypothetical protein